MAPSGVHSQPFTEDNAKRPGSLREFLLHFVQTKWNGSVKIRGR